MIARVTIEIACDLCRASQTVSRISPSAATFAPADAMNDLARRGWARRIVKDGRHERVIAVCPECRGAQP